MGMSWMGKSESSFTKQKYDAPNKAQVTSGK